MPLPNPEPRERLHTRRYEFNGYQRADGLWDIEGRMTDVKSYGFDNDYRGRIEAEEPLHDMRIRLTLDVPQGVVTLEDILEEVVGEIADEYDIKEEGMRALRDGSVVVEGTVTIRDMNREFDWRLPDEEASTIAGLVLHEARRIPDTGQVFAFHGFRFEILRRQRNQITSIKVTPLGEAKPESSG